MSLSMYKEKCFYVFNKTVPLMIARFDLLIYFKWENTHFNLPIEKYSFLHLLVQHSAPHPHLSNNKCPVKTWKRRFALNFVPPLLLSALITNLKGENKNLNCCHWKVIKVEWCQFGQNVRHWFHNFTGRVFSRQVQPREYSFMFILYSC